MRSRNTFPVNDEGKHDPTAGWSRRCANHNPAR